MIVRLSGKLVEKSESSLVIDVNGLYYEVIVPASVITRIEESVDKNGNVHLITYHYLQVEPSKAFPVLVGFINEIEKDFFEKFITVSGIGPRAAVKALNRPISEIARAINDGNLEYLRTLPGIGLQRGKEIIAKLQGKIGRFGLIQDKMVASSYAKSVPDWQEEALSILLQLQYKRNEAMEMIKKALERSSAIHTAEDLLNEIYKQKVNK